MMIDSTNTGQDYLISPLWKTPFSSEKLRSPGGGVPSLVWLCLLCTAEFPDQVQLYHKLSFPSSQPSLNNNSKPHASLLTALCGENSDTRDLSHLDPRLWAVIIQIFDCLPSGLRTYTISLNDEALPLLQQIPNTATFSLMTILELPNCVALTDSSISQLKELHTLTAFDASSTQVSSYGLLSLARTLQMNDPLETTRGLKGPWPLRILRLKHCTGIDDAVYPTLLKFPLLSVVDLRGTYCHPCIATFEFAFSPHADRSLFSSDMAQSLHALQTHEKGLQMYSAAKEHQFALRIKTLCNENIAKALSQKKDSIAYYFRTSRMSADDYDLNLADEDWHSQESGNDEEASTFADMEELEDLSNPSQNAFSVREEEVLDEEVNDESEDLDDPYEEVNDESEDHDDSDERVIDIMNIWRELPDERQNESRDDAVSPSIRRTMGFRAYSHSEPDHKHSQIPGGELPTVSWLPDSLQGPDRQKPYWYDADWSRANTYVPMSLAKGKYDDGLMLYRPMRPWKLLEHELDAQIAKEVLREQVRTERHSHASDLVAPSCTKRRQVQEDMKSMTTEALRRRQIHRPPAGNQPSQGGSRNPFARKPTEARFPVTPNIGQPEGKKLKPISALKVPKLTQGLLQKGDHPTNPENRLIKSSSIANNLPTRGSLADSAKNDRKPVDSVSTDPGEEWSKSKTIQRHQRISISSSGSKSTRVSSRVKRKGGRNDGQAQLQSFDWASWASKKS